MKNIGVRKYVVAAGHMESGALSVARVDNSHGVGNYALDLTGA